MKCEGRGGVAIVTGAGRGIGREIAFSLAATGLTVAIFDADSDAAAAAASDALEEGYMAVGVQCDVGDRQSVRTCVENVAVSCGPPSILINNAGIYKSAKLEDVDPQDWLAILNVNLTGAFWCSQAVAPYLMEYAGGRIVNIASIGAKIGWEQNHAYCASKSGMLGLTRTLALELAHYGATVNAVCPGNTDTAMMALVDADVCRENGWPAGQFAEATKARIPLGRLGSTQDIASLVAFLCSEAAQFITGQAINVDGGLVMY